MHKWQMLASICALLVVFDEVNAGDREDIVAVHEALIAAWNANDVDAAQQYYAPDFTAFNPGGNLLTSWNWDRVKTWHETGSVNISQPRHRDIKVYGNTAILTYYIGITINLPTGKSKTQTRRSTSVMTKTSGQWKYQHYHASLLTPTNPE